MSMVATIIINNSTCSHTAQGAKVSTAYRDMLVFVLDDYAVSFASGVACATTITITTLGITTLGITPGITVKIICLVLKSSAL
jgi:hypothetical protein